MIKKHISSIIEEVTKADSWSQKVAILKQHDNAALRGYLKMALDKNLKWLVPEGRPPFKPCQELDVEFVPYNEFRRMYIFVGGNPNLKPSKCEQLFITFLESMSPKDAAFICDVVKDKRLPEGLDEQIIRAAYPGL